MRPTPTEASPGEVRVEIDGAIATVTLARPHKRNALSLRVIEGLREAFETLPESVKAVVLAGDGEHFCAGLDLSELPSLSPAEGMMHSRAWYAAFDKIQFGSRPVVCVMHGAVVGGGLELATAAHVRVADDSAYFGLPEGRRGIFLGGGGSVRVSRLIGASRVTEMMLTGHVYSAAEGLQLGLAHHLVPVGQGLRKGRELALRIAANAPMSNFAIMHALPLIAEQPMSHGLLTEALMATVTASEPEARERVNAFLEKRAGKVLPACDAPMNPEASPVASGAALATAAPARALALGPYEAVATQLDGGGWLLDCTDPLRPYPRRYTESLVRWARERPGQTFLAQRDSAHGWRRLDYASAWARVSCLAQALLDRGLSAERPLMILSGNSIEHALLMLAALHVGVAVAPLSPAYALLDRSAAKVRHAASLLTPGLVFADDGAAFERAIGLALAPDTEVVLLHGALSDRPHTAFDALEQATPGAAVQRAHEAIDGDTIAKFLFTSGSTQMPKAVINTHRMLCCNQQMYFQCYPFLADEPPVLVDWMPWHHTAGGNINLGLVLTHGGTLYIDDGKPTEDGLAQTLRNLREIAPTVYYTVPKGLEALAREMRHDDALRRSFFSRLRLIFPAGAGLAQAVQDEIDAMAVQTVGERIPMTMGLGMTETAPSSLSAHLPDWRAGLVGLPVAGVSVKLVPVAGKLEVRYRGPNVTPGYWRQPDLTQAAFDEQGYFRSGDAVRFVNDENPAAGLCFDGRIAEDFKLASGTWVNVAALRARVMAAGSPHVQDVAFAGHDRNEVGVLLFLWPASSALSGTLAPGAPMAAIVRDPQVRAWAQALLDGLAASAGGSSQRIVRALLEAEPPSAEHGELTDKGSINQRAVLARRSASVQALYALPPDARVLRARPTSAQPNPPPLQRAASSGD